MAVTNMWAVKGSVSSVIKYIENPEKTTARDMEHVMSYITDADKTEKMMYVTGINCEPEIAAKQFMQTKRLWDKEGGRVAYHGYQSFRAGEVDAETAHKIGVELAQRLWGDRFEVVVATHLNTDHYHNHFCLNSVSFADGYKYHDTKEDIKRMRDTSDAICRRYGLSVESRAKIDQDRRRNYRELRDTRAGDLTLRNSIKADIDAAIKYSRTVKEFASLMRDKGYRFIITSETGKDLKYPKIQLPNSNRCVRLKSLGPGYDLDDYRLRIIRNTIVENPFSDLEEVKSQETIDRYRTRLERAGYRVVITYHSLQLSSCKRRRKYREYSPALLEDIRKLDRFIRLQDFCRKHRLDTVDDIDRFKTEIQDQISKLAEERKECRKEQKHWERKDVPAYVNLWKMAAQEKTKQMRPLYQELRMCDELLNSGPKIRENTINLVQQRAAEEQRRKLRLETAKQKTARRGHIR